MLATTSRTLKIAFHKWVYARGLAPAMALEAAEHHWREDRTHPEDDRPKNVARNLGINRPDYP
jgi:hypothetical protein